ncbi:hypothetical protein P280DRAFT_546165 [Massarina eburnea CBS 473.64]|uniref:Uncharacterized protein n=1 Tax=Massarina eburnea CBS 473.64 TaxID=1395130 RepID=A0A6A6SAY5_9PLEO|nr:hypothetical protein P280DRAFT_546165 [Massarina eburnea CBS 473.64]
MALGQAQPHYDGPSSRRQPCSARSRRDNRRLDCPALERPASSASRRAAYHRCESTTPSCNRFSILADLDSASPTKWAFDFVQTTAVRHRGKRAGKHNRLKNTAQQKNGALRDKISTELAEKGVSKEPPKVATTGSTGDGPRGNFTFTVDAVRHHWLPQFRPNSDQSTLKSTLRAPETLSLRPPEPCLTTIQGQHCSITTPPPRHNTKKFIASSLLAASPSTTVSSRAPAEISQPAGKQSSSDLSTPAQKAVAAACRAAASQISDMVPPARPSGQSTSSTVYPSLFLQSLDPPPYSQFVSLDHPSSMSSPYALPITSPHTVAPTLSTSSAVSDLTRLPTILPVLPPPHRLSPVLSPRFLSHQVWGEPNVTIPGSLFPRSLITAPIMSSRPFIQSGTSYLAKPGPARPVLPELSNPERAAEIQKEVDDFLKMGHADPCWCSKYCKPTDEVPGPPLPLRSQITFIRKRNFDNTELTIDVQAPTFSSPEPSVDSDPSGMEASSLPPSTPSAYSESTNVEVSSLSHSTTSTQSDSDLSELGYSGGILTPSDSDEDWVPDGSEDNESAVMLTPHGSEHSSQQEEDWTLVTPDPERYTQLSDIDTSPLSPSPILAPSSTNNLAPLTSSPTPTFTPVSTLPITPNPAPSPPTALRATLMPSRPSSPESIPPANPTVIEGKCPDCMQYLCVCEGASTSVDMEWPTL